MRIHFLGAAQTVTGSCYLVEAVGKRFMVDCGMFQGNKELRAYNRQDFSFNPGEIDFLLLTHAHIDHCGLIPRLYQSGFANPVYGTRATAELCKISLPDSGHIQELEAQWRNRKNARKGLPEEAPLYTANDALACLQHFQGVDYEQTFEPAPGIKVRFLDAGHIMGSAIIELWAEEGGRATKVVFSGDLGQKDQPIIKDPTLVAEADYVLVESTYGNRFHEDNTGKLEQLKQIILSSTASGGNLIIPAFAIGRTQDLLYHLRNLLLEGKIPEVPVYIDSPMAISMTEIYHNHPGYYDEPTLAMLRNGNDPFNFPGLHFVRTVEESVKLNETANGAIIISASGMCESGRILHHLKHNVWRSGSHILFVGYQAEGTLGRRLMEGAKVVKILGEEVDVQAQIHSIGGFSAHADQKGLLEWLQGFTVKPRGVFVVHGEKEGQTQLAGLIRERLGTEVVIPVLKDQYRLEEALHREVIAAEPVSRVANDYYSQIRVLADLEHAALSLRSKIRKGGAGGTQVKTDISEMKQMLEELEALVGVSAQP